MVSATAEVLKHNWSPLQHEGSASRMGLFALRDFRLVGTKDFPNAQLNKIVHESPVRF